MGLSGKEKVEWKAIMALRGGAAISAAWTRSRVAPRRIVMEVTNRAGVFTPFLSPSPLSPLPICIVHLRTRAVKLSNMARVLRSDLTLNPTQIERMVREQARLRAEAHERRNQARCTFPLERGRGKEGA